MSTPRLTKPTLTDALTGSALMFADAASVASWMKKWSAMVSPLASGAKFTPNVKSTPAVASILNFASLLSFPSGDRSRPRSRLMSLSSKVCCKLT